MHCPFCGNNVLCIFTAIRNLRMWDNAVGTQNIKLCVEKQYILSIKKSRYKQSLRQTTCPTCRCGGGSRTTNRHCWILGSYKRSSCNHKSRHFSCEQSSGSCKWISVVTKRMRLEHPRKRNSRKRNSANQERVT